MHVVDADQFNEFCDDLAGLKAKNKLAVQARLVELGLSLAPVTD